MATDTLIACLITREVADHYGLLLLPPVTIACSLEDASWAGTVSISAATLHAVIDDLVVSPKSSGTHHLLIVNGHGRDYALSNIVQEASTTGPDSHCSPLATTGARRARPPSVRPTGVRSGGVRRVRASTCWTSPANSYNVPPFGREMGRPRLT